jgi:hypothetical protein
MRCPTLEDVTAATLALLPRGRAWQTHEGPPRPGREVAFAPTAFQNDAFATDAEPVSRLWQYWRSVAEVFYFANKRLCDLRLEFWCQTVNETRDEWMTEYGLPDDCDPFPDLCTKVAAIGGTRCDYYAQVAARMGWSIECSEAIVFCGSRAGHALAGRARAGTILGRAKLKVIVHLNESPSFSGGRSLPALAGRFRAGRRQICGPDISPLKCLMSRVVHAEIQIVYEGRNS